MMYKTYNTNVCKFDLHKQLTGIREDYKWVADVFGHTLQDVANRLAKTYESFYKGGGFPKWAKQSTYNSFTFPDGVKLYQDLACVYLPKIGKVKYHKSREVDGKVKTATVKREANGWFIYVVCETEIEQLEPIIKEVGIDLGIKDFATFSDGTKVSNPKHLEKYEHKLKRLQRNVTRKKKGSNNRKKAIQKLALCHLKIKNSRKDFHHKLSTQIIRENQTIAVEGLKVEKMNKRLPKSEKPDGTFAPNGQKQKSQLNKSINSAGWGQFTTMLEYKSKWYGRNLIKVPPQYTSQECNVCGHRNEQLTLQVREWKCPSCGTEHDRDINAAINIKNKGRGAHAVSLEVIQSQ